MTVERTHNPMLWSTIAIVALVAITGIAGLFWPAVYARETAYSRAGAQASDIVNLFLVLPVLLISGVLGYRGSLVARLVWLGTLGYLLYNFVIYAFGVHFNLLFLIYCATLSLCFYVTIFSARLLPLEQIALTFAPRAPRKTIAIVFLYLVASTAFLEMRSDVAAILAGQVPKDVTDATTPVDFIHVLDLGFLLPGLCITAILLFLRRQSGYALAPAFLTLLAIMSMELVTIMAVLGRRGFGMSVPMIAFFAALAVGFTALLGFYVWSAKRAAMAAAASR